MEKRHTVEFIPYQRKESGPAFFVQRRSLSATRKPGWYGLWGGGIEKDETPEEALVREIKEELNISITDYILSHTYENDFTITTVFYKEVPEDFENEVTVLEGEYGKFFTIEEIEQLDNMTNDVKETLRLLYSKLI